LKLLNPYRRYQHPHVVASLIGRQFSICGIEAAQEGYFPNASPVSKTDVLEVAPLHFSGSKFTLSIIDQRFKASHCARWSLFEIEPQLPFLLFLPSANPLASSRPTITLAS